MQKVRKFFQTKKCKKCRKTKRSIKKGGTNETKRKRQEVKDSEENCSICLDPLKKLKTIINSDNCNHKFHKKCLEKWLKINKSCALCRSDQTKLAKKLNIGEKEEDPQNEEQRMIDAQQLLAEAMEQAEEIYQRNRYNRDPETTNQPNDMEGILEYLEDYDNVNYDDVLHNFIEAMDSVNSNNNSEELEPEDFLRTSGGNKKSKNKRKKLVKRRKKTKKYLILKNSF